MHTRTLPSPSKRHAVVLALVAVFAAGACARRNATEQGAADAARDGAVTTRSASVPDCPMALPGSSTTATDVDRGVALTITAPPDQLADLRARARRMEAVSKSAGGAGSCACPVMGDGGTMGGGMMGGGMMHGDGGMRTEGGGGMMAMPPADVRVEDVEGGVRVTLTARDDKDVASLRQHARMHIEHMKGGGCPMM